MGFELNKLMRQFGVSTPGVVNYSGPAAPVIPTAPTGERPAGDDDAAKAKQTAYDNQLAAANAYKTDPSAFNDMARKYNLAQKEYDQYKNTYTGRLQNTPMYQDAQYQTGPSAGMAYATREGGIGADKYNQNIRDYVTNNPTATPTQLRAEMDKYGVSGYDTAQARGGSMWGNAVTGPTYGAVPLSLGSKTQQEKIDYYNNLRTLGYTDADIRGAAESSFGKLPDADWNVLSGKNNTAVISVPATTLPAYNGMDSININGGVAGVNTGTGWIGGTGGGNLGGVNAVNNTNPYGFIAPEAGSINSQGFVEYHNPTTGQTWTARSGGWTAPSGWVQGPLDLSKLDLSKAPGADHTVTLARGGSVYSLANKYAQGGQVKTHYQTAGAVKLPSGYGSAEEEADFAQRFFTPSPVEINPINMDSPPQAIVTDIPERVAAQPVAPLTQVAINSARAASEPMAPAVVAPPVPAAMPKPPAAIPFGGERLAGIQALLASYGPKDSAYGEDLKAARASAKAETDAFAKMLTGAMKSPEDEKSSKAEMYFRLAAAFGAPTKTGQFSENLGLVGKELGEYSKDKRASAQQKLALAIKAQEMKMTGAKEDLKTLQALTGEEMKDKRAIATELIKDYIKSGEPQSAAGKQALDEGLKPGTPDYQKRVNEIGNLNVEGRLAQINASLAGVNLATANLALNQEKFQNQKNQQAKLSPAEMKLKTETEDTLAQTDAALSTLKQAYALNPNTFDTSLSDMAQRKALEITDSKNPKVVATREQENLLEKAALAQLKSTFPGAISNDERKALQDVQGLGAKSRDERAKIMKNAYTALQSISARHKKRLNEINQGLYRDTAAPGIDGGND